jgi:hypothetical protein
MLVWAEIVSDQRLLDHRFLSICYEFWFGEHRSSASFSSVRLRLTL